MSRTIRPSELKAILHHVTKIKQPAFIWGGPGIGKSDVVSQVAAEQGRPVIDIRLALMDPTDIRGMPYADSEGNGMKWSPPSELPKAGTPTENAILFLDEMNSAPPSVQAAAYQLVLNRRIGEYELPEGVSIVAAGNRETDKGVTYRMPAPLANRFLHFNIESNFEDWQKWAILNEVHPDVVGFLSSNHGNLYKFDPKSPDKSFATPRSWEFVSRVIDDSASLSEKLVGVLVAGGVGEGMATEFMQHRRVAAKMPKPEDVLSGKVTKLEVKEISAKYSLAVGLCYLLKEVSERANDPTDKEMTSDRYHEMFDNFFRFIMDNFEVEMVVLAAMTALSTYELKFSMQKLKTIQEFHKKYASYIIDER